MDDLLLNVFKQTLLISPKKTNLLSQFFHRIKLFIKRKFTANTIALKGRIHELQSDVEEVILGLLQFKNIIKKEADQQLLELIKPIIRNLIKEITSVNSLIQEKQSTALQVKLVHHYVNWLENAKTWSRLASLPYDEETVYQAIVIHSSKMLVEHINRDIKVIQKYLLNKINHLEGNSEAKKTLKAQLEIELTPYFSELNELTKIPENISLDSFTSWRTIADQSRENCFSSALHVVDTFTEEIY